MIMVIKMEKKKTKKEIVKMLLKNNELEEGDDEEVLDLLIEQPISIDIDKQEEAKMTKGDRIADKVSEIAGSWGFILGFCLFLLFWIILNGFLLHKGKEIDAYPILSERVEALKTENKQLAEDKKMFEEKATKLENALEVLKSSWR